jgi:hypothetical protein
MPATPPTTGATHANTRQAVAVVQRAMRGGQTPEAAMAELGFGRLQLIKAFPVNMSGALTCLACALCGVCAARHCRRGSGADPPCAA